MRVTLRAEADAPDEALEWLYGYLAEDRVFFAEARPERIYSPPEQGALSGGVLVEILAVIGAINAGQSVADAARTVRALADKLHGFVTEHRGRGVRAVTVSTESGQTATVTEEGGPAKAEAAVHEAILEAESAEERDGAETP